MKRLSLILCLLLLSGCASGTAPAGPAGSSLQEEGDQWAPADLRDSSIQVYMVLNEDLAKLLSNLFEEKTGCKVSYVCGSAEEALQALTDSPDHPGADVLLGGSVDIHETLKNHGMLARYVPAVDNSQSGRYADYGKVWNAVSLECLSVGVNTDRLGEKYGLTECPSTLEELTDEKFRGDIVVAEPNQSKTGYLFFTSVLTNYGTEKGFDLLTKLMENVVFSGNDLQAVQQAGLGEKTFVIGCLSDQLRMKDCGLSIESRVYRNSGWTITPVSLIEKSENTEAAKSFINFVLTEEAGRIIAGMNFSFPIRDSIEAPVGISHSIASYPVGSKFNPVKHYELREYAMQLYEKQKGRIPSESDK